MSIRQFFSARNALALTLSVWVGACGLSLAVAQTKPQLPLQTDSQSKIRVEQTGPIASIAHGAMLDPTGVEIMPSLHFVEIAQKWYRDRLLKKLSARDRVAAERMERRFASDVNLDRQSRLLATARILDWVLERSSAEEANRARTRLHVLHRHLKVQLPEESSTEWSEYAVPFEINPDLLRRLQKDKTLTAPGRAKLLLVTPTSGLPYRQLCSDHGVPLPEDFGPGMRWQSQGTYTGNELYLARGLNAEVLSFQSTTPPGLCVALPRYGNDQIVQADGVICFGQTDPLGGPPKACF